jgi:hypothetical protein
VNEAGLTSVLTGVVGSHYRRTHPNGQTQKHFKKLLTVDSMNKYKSLCKKLSSVPTTRTCLQSIKKPSSFNGFTIFDERQVTPCKNFQEVLSLMLVAEDDAVSFVPPQPNKSGDSPAASV